MVMGPAVGAILGDLGAEVIKIEPISGDKTRVLKKSGSGYFLTYNRNKRSLAMDINCLLYTSPSPRDATLSRMPSSA